ncbi:MAG: hypothetical protein LBQ22_00330 [Bacteroidales bacterium]|jgi:molybdopterin converting factor small subunit|nr:hypothetical protein [Bacteroidales bacterium]
MKKRIFLKFPPQFSKLINNQSIVEFAGDNLLELINYLDCTYGNNIRERLLNDENRLRLYLNIFIGENNINSLEGINSLISDGDKISLILPRAGG